MALLLLVSITLMVVDHRQHQLDSVRAGLATLLYPLHYAVDFPSAASGWLSSNIESRAALMAENELLQAHQLLQDVHLQKLHALEAENERLRSLYSAPITSAERLLVGELFSVTVDPVARKVMINHGSRDDVYVGQPVLDARGVMGQIISVTPLTSTALLISDPSHALSVMVARSGLRAIAMGTGSSDRLAVPHIPNHADIQVGDILLTSGLDGRFPPNFPVATVAGVEWDPEQPFARVTATPTARLDYHREVLLMWPVGGIDRTAPRATAPAGDTAAVKQP